MPKVIPQEVRLRGMELYLEGNLSAREIAETLTTEYNVDVKTPTIYAWAKKDEWDDQKVLAKTQGMQQLAETESSRFARLQEAHLNQYEDMTKRALYYLKFMESDVVRLIIEVKRKLMSEEDLLKRKFTKSTLSKEHGKYYDALDYVKFNAEYKPLEAKAHKLIDKIIKQKEEENKKEEPY